MYKFRLFEEYGVYISIVRHPSDVVSEAWVFEIIHNNILKHTSGYYNSFEIAEINALKKAIEYL